ncbi:hypothetical protein GH714_012899 [Hevea brasiliensis]|uniref:Protein kinase domain-containing protein n=1 Tax=Hevea brasiliensis TaxID=3981 RepID=A0A6A6LRH2_HEVBR|nr:hypothetical protein GH714_012899 [Hevea brasiliensis]
MSYKFFSIFVLLLQLILQFGLLKAQQAYLANHQLDCDDWTPGTKGYLCNGVQSSCQSYVTFQSNPPYTSPVNIGYLLGTQGDATRIASMNNISSDVAKIPAQKQVGLTTCQALREQNPYDMYNLYAGLDIHVPLRCACPTSNQTAFGAKYMLTYMPTWDDDVSKIAQLFNVSEQNVLDANELLEDDLIYPFTPILVPISSEPSMIPSPPYSPPPTRSPPVDVVLVSESNSSKKGVYEAIASKNNDLPITYEGIQHSIESLIIYKFEDIQSATGYFKEENKIKGSVYKGSFKGDHAAVKVMKGDVSGEINMLKKINHSNIARLSGFCVHDGNTYLACEYVQNGSLEDWLHSGKNNQTSCALSWKQRLQIAYNVADAFNYLHNYTTPPFVHKNLNTSNVLLDGDIRAKIVNFGLARKLANDGQGATWLTRHVVGTHGYMAPEYLENGLITPKLDVFAYGL